MENSFAYVSGNPLSHTDPRGLCIGPLIAPCAWALANAPWLVPTSLGVTEAALFMASGAVSPVSSVPAVVPAAVSRLRPVAGAIYQGVESGAFACIPKSPALTTGSLVERTFMTAHGPVDFAAEAVVSNGHLLLKDAVLYGRGADPLTGMSRDIYRGFGTMKDWA